MEVRKRAQDIWAPVRIFRVKFGVNATVAFTRRHAPDVIGVGKHV